MDATPEEQAEHSGTAPGGPSSGYGPGDESGMSFTGGTDRRAGALTGGGAACHPIRMQRQADDASPSGTGSTSADAVLLVNLGTPDAPTSGAVRRYLREFLSDPRVIDINPIGRALLLHLIILPFRSSKSAKLYQNIWTEEGSPLLLHSQALRDKVQDKLGDSWMVELAMRYGNPNIPSALDRLQAAGCDQIVVLALYPQNASSSSARRASARSRGIVQINAQRRSSSGKSATGPSGVNRSQAVP